MTRTASLLLSAFVGVFGGCAVEIAPPTLTPDHPASSSAPAAPTPRHSDTLDPRASPGLPTRDAAPMEGQRGGHTGPHNAAGSGTTPVYTCPMHPEVRAKAPGLCPKCGMMLRPVDSDDDAPHAH